jgi:hypothetical protein
VMRDATMVAAAPISDARIVESMAISGGICFCAA